MEEKHESIGSNGIFRAFAEGILQHSRMNFALPALIWNSAMDLLQYLVRFPDYKVHCRVRE